MLVEKNTGHLSDLITELQAIARFRYLAAEQQLPAADVLVAKENEIVAEVNGYQSEVPEMFSELEQNARARLEAGLGMLAVMLVQKDTALTPEDANYYEQTGDQVDFAAALVEGFEIYREHDTSSQAKPADQTTVELIKGGVSTEAEPEPEAVKEPVDFDITFKENGDLIVNGLPLKLLPAQRFIFEAYLAAGRSVSERDLYHSDEFRKVVEDEGQTSPVTGAYGNALRGMNLRLEKHGIAKPFIAQVGGGPRSREMRVTSSVRVTDERFTLEELGGIADTESKGKSRELVERTRQMLVDIVTSQESVSRSGFVDLVMAHLEIDQHEAQRLVAHVYADELKNSQPQFKQTRNGGRRFGRISEAADRSEADDGFAGPYFNGTEAEFKQRYGEVKGVTPDFVNYARGIIPLTGIEQALLNHFKLTGERKAVSEKSVIKAIEDEGITVTNAQLHAACEIINKLAGKTFLDTLGPASRYSGVKGPRVQMIGAFMEVNK